MKWLMLFPESSRVVYRNNPLMRVTCHLRFPPILRIDSENPAAYQEKIRGSYPLYQQGPMVNLPANLPDEIRQVVQSLIVQVPTKVVRYFLSQDQAWRIELASDSWSIATQRYQHWEDFKEQMDLPLRAFTDGYQPAFFQRIGLRYQNVIRRSSLDLTDVRWAELLAPHIAAELASAAIAPAVKQARHDVVASLPEYGGQVRIQHHLGLSQDTKEPCYVIDGDFFTDSRTEVKDVANALDYFKKEAGRLFRWCISDRLHDAMGPTAVA